MRGSLAAGLCLALGLLLSAAPAGAADFGRAAEETARELAQARAEAAEAKGRQAARLAGLEAELASLREEAAAEEAGLERARQELTRTAEEKQRLRRRLREEQGELEELAGLVRASARELLSLSEAAPFTAFHPRRLEELKGYLNQERFPGLADITRLTELYFAFLADTGRVHHRRHRVVAADGGRAEAEVAVLGFFTALYRHGGEVGFLTLGPATGRLLAVGGEPPWGVRRAAAAYLDGESPAPPLDLSGGAALRHLARRETAWERLLSGGPLVWPILLVGLVSLVLVVERLVFLRRVRANTDQVMGRVNRMVQAGDIAAARETAQAQPGRPTTNVIKAGLELAGSPPEVVEAGLSEAMLRELPRLERFLTALKVMAAVAPLLGLLGTVTGMINTFQVITTHGAGDPRLMAGGISEALVTTQLGLAVAIPVLVAASLLGRRAQRLASDMEEKAVALVAALSSQPPPELGGGR
jgi:biopolymer transport protein ExbB